MTLLFSEKGSIVGCYDYEAKAVEKVMQQAKEDPVVDESKVHGFTKLELMVKAFPQGMSWSLCVHFRKFDEPPKLIR